MTRSEFEAARTEAWKNNDWQLAGRIQIVLDKMGGLVDSATTVRDRLTRLIEGFETEGMAVGLDRIGHSFNTIGEIQGSGSEIDRLCGEVGMAVGALKELKRDRADRTKPERMPTPPEQGEAAGRQEAATRRPKTYAARATGRAARSA